MRLIKWILGVVVLLVAAAAAYRFLYVGPTLRARVAADLKDPDSAKFRNEKYRVNWLLTDGYYCGEINAKNGLGGYTGYQGFNFIVEDGEVRNYDLTWKNWELFDLCNGMPFPWWWIRW